MISNNRNFGVGAILHTTFDVNAATMIGQLGSVPISATSIPIIEEVETYSSLDDDIAYCSIGNEEDDPEIIQRDISDQNKENEEGTSMDTQLVIDENPDGTIDVKEVEVIKVVTYIDLSCDEDGIEEDSTNEEEQPLNFRHLKPVTAIPIPNSQHRFRIERKLLLRDGGGKSEVKDYVQEGIPCAEKIFQTIGGKKRKFTEEQRRIINEEEIEKLHIENEEEINFLF